MRLIRTADKNIAWLAVLASLATPCASWAQDPMPLLGGNPVIPLLEQQSKRELETDVGELFPAQSSPEAIPPAPPPTTFELPGGYGRAPETITVTDAEVIHRPKFRSSMSLELGYDDNVLESSGKKIGGVQASPIVGSWFINPHLTGQYKSLGRRYLLSLDATAGGSLYADRAGSDPFQPDGSFLLTGIAKLNGSTQLSAIISAAYYSQPNLALVNAPTQARQAAYLNVASQVDLEHHWTRAISTDTTLTQASQTFVSGALQDSDNFSVGIGEALRYAIVKKLAAVAEIRAEETSYTNSGDSTDTQFVLVGLDCNFGKRFAGAFRVGETFLQAGSAERNHWFLESTLSYGFGKSSRISWANRYGFENGTSASETRLTYRTGLHFSFGITRRLRASADLDYAHAQISSIIGTAEESVEETFQAAVGLEYLLTRRSTCYIRGLRSQVIAADALSSYSRNQAVIGWTFQF